MKKYFYLAIVAIATIACNEGFNEPEEINTEDITIGETIFTGRLASTKTSLGEKEGSSYKILWEDGDELSIADAESGDFLGTATLTSGIGENDGVFSFPGTIANGTEVTLTYEGSAIAAEQSKASSDRSFKGAATATATVNDGAADFTMVQTSAVIRVNVASTDLAGATLNAVIFRSESADLNVDGGDYVRVALTDTPELNSTAQEIVFAVKAADLSGQEIDIAFELTSSGEDFTLPVGFKGKQLATDSVNSFNFSNLSETQCVPWYEPHDTRLMPSPGYAYGEANCYFIQCKGTTYTGATYTANDAIPNKVSIDFRARGDFRKVTAPKDVSFTFMKLGATDASTGTGTGAVYTMRTVGYTTGSIIPSRFTIGSIGENYKVTVSNWGAYAGAPVMLMVKDGTVLWAWSFWNIAADGTSIEPVQITDKSPIKIITMDIGQASREGALWDANSDILYRTAYKYQWGRPIPVFWNSVTTLDIPGVQEGNIPAVVGPLSIEESIKHPASLIVASTSSGQTLNDWLSEPDADLWGNNDSSTLNATGTKTIFDPCPKGYRICDRNTLSNLVRSFATDWTKISGTGYFFHTCNYPTGGSDCWSRNGCYNGTTNTSSSKTGIGGFAAAATGDKSGWWWTNMCQGDSDEKPSAYVAADNAAPTFNDNWQYKSWAASVRCQVDEYNR
ncbi:MAG: hypothetical protein IJQ93_02085 [Bacteroidales bacterium]|nr:hypothetical protein [Bacteroidales bacterium]